MSKIFRKIREHLADNGGDENLTRVIIIAIVFIVGALLITGVIAAINKYYKSGTSGKIHDILN